MNPSANPIINKPQTSLITIIFAKSTKTYFAGEMVSGIVRFQAQDNQSVQTFSVQLRGEFYFMKETSEHVENIFTESMPMDYRGAGEGNVEVDFNLVLKPTSPTSLQSPLGGIRYCVQSTVVFSENDKLQIAEGSEFISVNQPHQSSGDCSGRSVRTVERTGIFCCVRSITAEMGVSSTCLLSGQAAIISGFVLNKTHSTIKGTAVNLIQTLQRQKDGKRVKKTASSLEKGVILPGKRETWLSEYIIVPPLPPTSCDSYFKIWYEVVLEIQMVGGKLIKLKIPVVIGNVPNTNSTFTVLDSDDLKFEWKSSETLDEANEFIPLYATHVA